MYDDNDARLCWRVKIFLAVPVPLEVHQCAIKVVGYQSKIISSLLPIFIKAKRVDGAQILTLQDAFWSRTIIRQRGAVF